MKDFYEIIRFQPYGNKYIHKLSDQEYENQLYEWQKYSPKKTIDDVKRFFDDKFIDYIGYGIPLGQSRVGGPIVDLPYDIPYPDDYYFMAQINCKEFKPYDVADLLPNIGFLYFFTKHPMDTGIVKYSKANTDELIRTTKGHLDVMFFGQMMDTPSIEYETIKSRYYFENDKWKWNDFKGGEISKIYGIYSNCQADEEDIKEFMKDEKRIILLQIGADFLGEGCQNVFINIDDLKEGNFENCIFEYNQS